MHVEKPFVKVQRNVSFEILAPATKIPMLRLDIISINIYLTNPPNLIKLHQNCKVKYYMAAGICSHNATNILFIFSGAKPCVGERVAYYYVGCTNMAIWAR